MQPDLLQQLRDIHLPSDPIWWPPAPGWWLLVILAIAGLVWLVRELKRHMARRKPIKEAQALYLTLHDEYLAGRLEDHVYLHQANELLKRMFIHGLKDDRARRANDEQWLKLLDERSGSSEFSTGCGRQLGNQRFRPAVTADVETLHPLLVRLFRESVRLKDLSAGAGS